MQIQCITQFSELVSMRQEWDQLFTSSRQQHPFLSFSWVFCWWQHLLPVSKIASHQLYILLARTDEGKLVGIAPFFKTSYFGSKTLRYIRPIGSDPNLTEIKPLVCLHGLELSVVQAIDRYLAARTREWEFCQWLDLPLRAVEYFSLERTLSKEKLTFFFLDLSSGFEKFRSTRKRNIKESLRKCYKKAEEDCVKLVFISLGDSAEIQHHLPIFYNIHAMRAQSVEGTEHPDYFREVKHRLFLEAFLKSDGPAKCRLFLLKHGDKIIAARIGFEINDVLYMYFSGYDPKYAPYSVTTRLLVEVMQDALSRGIHQMNLSTGRDVSKTRWSPDEYHFVRPFVVSPNLKARMTAKIFHLLKKLHRLLARNPIQGKRSENKEG